MALTDLIGWRRIGRKGGILKNKKTVPEQVGFRFSPALLFVVLRIYLRACEDGLRRITVLLRCDPALRVADGSCHCL